MPASRKRRLRTWGAWGAHTITIVNRAALGAIIIHGAFVQRDFLFMMDNSCKDAFFKDVPELVAFTPPTMGSELNK